MRTPSKDMGPLSLGLRLLRTRLNLTQQTVGKALGRIRGLSEEQVEKKKGSLAAEICQLEKGPRQMQVRTLIRYIEAMGGKVEIVAVVGRKRTILYPRKTLCK